jgi:GTP-binding protein
VAINKLDLPEVKERYPTLEKQFRQLGYRPLPISALVREGLRELMYAAYRLLQETEPVDVVEEDLPVYKPGPAPDEFEITREPDGSWRVKGVAVERAAEMTYWEYDEAVRRYQRLLARLGVEDALRTAGARPGDTVHIGEYELEWLE